MLRSIFFKTLRDYRAALIGWSLAFALILFVTAQSYSDLVGPGLPGSGDKAAELTKLLQSFSVLLGDVVTIDTLGSFITVRSLGTLTVIMSMWALVMGVGAIRGEEGTGAMDLLLSTPQPRGRVLFQKIAGIALVIIVAATVAWLGLWAGYAVAKTAMPIAASLAAFANIAAIALFWGAVGLLAGQVWSPRRRASSIAGAFLFGTYILNNIFETAPGLTNYVWLTPWHYFSVSKPLASGRTIEWAAWLGLLAAALLATYLAARLFVSRDIGSGVSLWRSGRQTQTRMASPAMMGSLFTKSIGDIMGTTLAWALGIGILGAIVVATTNSTLEPIRRTLGSAQNSWITQLFGTMATPEAYTETGAFLYFKVFFVALGILQVANWVSDEEEGRLELQASMPVPRWQIPVARYVALLATDLIAALLIWAAVMLAAVLSNVALDGSRVLGGLLAAVPLSMVVAAFGICVATLLRRPGPALPLTIAVVVTMFFMDLFAPLLKLPDIVSDLSIFQLYGKPLTEGIRWGGMLALVLATVVLAVGSLLGIQRRDITK